MTSKQAATAASGSSANASGQPQKIYYISCSGTGYVTMGEDRLEAMFEAMPTLKFLLMGHPNMQAKPINEMKDGTQVLEIPEELEVSKPSFVLLVNCFFGADKLPPRGPTDSRLTELLETVATLGGCMNLEEKLKDLSKNPLTPEEDTENEYVWGILQADIYQSDKMDDIKRKGYSYTTSRKLEQYGSITHYFRAPKGTPPIQPRTAPGQFDFDGLQQQMAQQQAQLQQQLAQQRAQFQQRQQAAQQAAQAAMNQFNQFNQNHQN